MRAIIGAVLTLAGRVDAQAGGAVGEHDGRNAEALDGIGRPGGAGHDLPGGADGGGDFRLVAEAGHAGTDHKVDFLFQRHRLQDLVHGGLPQLRIPAGGGKHHSGGKKQDSLHKGTDYLRISLISLSGWLSLNRSFTGQDCAFFSL